MSDDESLRQRMAIQDEWFENRQPVEEILFEASDAASCADGKALRLLLERWRGLVPLPELEVAMRRLDSQRHWAKRAWEMSVAAQMLVTNHPEEAFENAWPLWHEDSESERRGTQSLLNVQLRRAYAQAGERDGAENETDSVETRTPRDPAMAAIPAAIALMKASMSSEGAEKLEAVIAEHLPERLQRLIRMSDGPLPDRPNIPESM